MRRLASSLTAAALVAAPVAPAVADPHSGVDSALVRPAIDTSGVFSLEGARPMHRRDLSWKMFFGFAQKPFDVAVPGIGGEAGDMNTDADPVLDYAVSLDLAFGIQLTNRLTVGFDAALYRAEPGAGYGERGRYNGLDSTESTGLISLRPLSNIDPSGGFEDQALSGPLDVRVVAKYLLKSDAQLAMSAMLAAGVPFGEDEMFLGDVGIVVEPRFLIDYRLDRVSATKFVGNVGLRLRERTVLEAYDKDAPAGMDTPDNAVVVADIGSEVVVGGGMIFELSPSLHAAAEVVGLVPLPGAISYGDCRRHSGERCSTIDDEDYFGDAGAGDLTAYANLGGGFRASPHLMINVMGGLGLLGMRADDFRVAAGLTWSPQPKGVAELGRGDRDSDGLPDVSDSCLEDAEDSDGFQDDDGCPDVDNDGDGVLDADDSCADQPEDRDAFQDQDGCPEFDNDNDTITDVADRCPDQPEEVDGFEDDDGCPDDDNDGDGIADDKDRCVNDAETPNGIDDDDGCPDVRVSTGPEETADRINLKGNKIEFNGAALTNASRTILQQVATLIRNNNLTIRVEVHVPLGTKAKGAAAIRRQKQKDRDLSQRRAQAVLDFLVSQNVPIAQIQAVGLGSDRPLGNNAATDPGNERVDFIKAQQRNP